MFPKVPQHHNWLSKFGWSPCLLMILFSIRRHSRLNPLWVWSGLNSHRLTLVSCRPMHRGNHQNFVKQACLFIVRLARTPSGSSPHIIPCCPCWPVCSFLFVLVGTIFLKDIGLGRNTTFLEWVHVAHRLYRSLQATSRLHRRIFNYFGKMMFVTSKMNFLKINFFEK